MTNTPCVWAIPFRLVPSKTCANQAVGSDLHADDVALEFTTADRETGAAALHVDRRIGARRSALDDKVLSVTPWAPMFKRPFAATKLVPSVAEGSPSIVTSGTVTFLMPDV